MSSGYSNDNLLFLKKNNKLTGRQQQVLDFIIETIKVEGYPPTVRDIAAELGIISLNAVRRHLQALSKKGYIQLEPGKSRGIQVVEELSPISSVESTRVPILGRVAAGPLTEAIQDAEGFVSLDEGFWGDTRETFMLRVRGDSMYPRMEDGDLVIVRNQSNANPGQLVVARVEDEATVKKLIKKGDKYYLHPINPDYEDIPVNENSVINGIVMGLIRKI